MFGGEREARRRAALRSPAVAQLDKARMPKHVAIVMDGNGRWAERRGLKRTEGHAAGEEALFDAVEGALEIGLQWMTVYAFSTENWRRPLDEGRFLMNFNERLLVARRDELNGKGVRVRFIGRRTGRVARRVLRRIEETEALTARNPGASPRGTAGSLSRSRSTTAGAPSSPTRCARSPRKPRRAGSIRRRSTRRCCAGISTRPTCPIPTCSCAHRASTGSRTISCGSSRTRS